MKRFKSLVLAVAGVVLPVVLVFSAYLMARGSIGAAGTVPPVPHSRISDAGTPSPAPSATSTQKDDRSGKRGGTPDDHGGRSPGSDSSGTGSDSSHSGRGGGGGDD